MSAWRVCEEELKKLPDNNQFTHRYCERFGAVLMVDGKYFSIASENHDWVLLWGIDYFKHDIPMFTIAPSETYQSWARYFSYFRLLSNYHPQLVVCDDNAGLKMAARSRFPSARIQTCYNHLKETIRRELKVRSEGREMYRDFMRRLEVCLNSKEKLNDESFNKRMFALFRDYRHDVRCNAILMSLERNRHELMAYRGIPGSPVTSNLIEGMNSHLERRLFALKSFQTVRYAKLWLNGYILKRRFTKWTDTQGKFRHLRGKTGVDQTKKERVILPLLF